jgi:hypothetical protein
MDMTTGAKYKDRNRFTPLNAPLIRSARIKARINRHGVTKTAYFIVNSSEFQNWAS